MSKYSNVEVFNRSVGIIFSKLYDNFPIRIELKFTDLTFDIFDNEDTENINYYEKHEVFSETVKWLEQAGYIWADRIDSWDAYSVVLSPKGLEVLKVVEDSDSKDSIGERLSKVFKSGTKEAAKTAVSSLVSFAMTEGYKILTK